MQEARVEQSCPEPLRGRGRDHGGNERVGGRRWERKTESGQKGLRDGKCERIYIHVKGRGKEKQE